METRCEKCGAPVGADQAFCPRCGAVVGMSGAAPDGGEGWDMPDTVLGRKPLAARRPSAEQPAAPAPAEAARPVRAEAARPARDDAAEVPPRAGGKTLLLAVIVFVAVLLVGGLLVMLYLTSEA